jgi:hypothetical protein
VLRRHVLRLGWATRARYEQLLGDAMSKGELRADTDVRALARMMGVRLVVLSWRGRCIGRAPLLSVCAKTSRWRSGRIWCVA